MPKKTTDNKLLQRFIAFGQHRFGNKFGWKKKYADALEISQAQLTNILSGGDPVGPKIKERLRNLLGYDIDEEPNRPGEIEKGMMLLMEVPVYEYVHAGTKQGVVAESPIDYIAIPKSKDNTQFGVKVRGNSMEPLIKEGDIVIVSRMAEVKSGDLCLVNYTDGEYCLRFIHFQGNLVTLTSKDESKYPPEVVKKNELHNAFRVMRLIKEF